MAIVDIKGKAYKTVAGRIEEIHRDHPGKVSITTDFIKNEDSFCIIRATVTIEHENGTFQAFNGTSKERAGDGFINKDSHIENCETSAIGRALSSAGYAGTEFASAEEVANAVSRQGNNNPPPRNTKPPEPSNDDLRDLVKSEAIQLLKMLPKKKQKEINEFIDNGMKHDNAENWKNLKERLSQLVKDELEKKTEKLVKKAAKKSSKKDDEKEMSAAQNSADDIENIPF